MYNIILMPNRADTSAPSAHDRTYQVHQPTFIWFCPPTLCPVAIYVVHLSLLEQKEWGSTSNSCGRNFASLDKPYLLCCPIPTIVRLFYSRHQVGVSIRGDIEVAILVFVPI